MKLTKDLKDRLAEMSSEELYQKVAEMMVLFSNTRKAGPASSWTTKAALPAANEVVTLVCAWIASGQK